MDEAILEDPLGLTRVTVQSARLRVDMALPATMAVAELFPHVLRFAGVAAADEAPGWTLRRADGQQVDPSRSLDGQGVRDGEVLALVPKRQEWPEPAPDDALEIITAASRQPGPRWSNHARRLAFLVTGGLVFAFGLLALAEAQPREAAAFGFGGAVLLVLTATTIGRAFEAVHASAALVVAAAAYAFAAGAFLWEGPPGVLLGSAGLLVCGVLGAAGSGAWPWLLAVVVTTSAVGLIGASLGVAGASTGGAAAVVVVLAAGALPFLPSLAVRWGRLPTPRVPARAEEILEPHPKPSPPLVYAAVARTASLLTGMVLGVSVAGSLAMILLMRYGGVSGVVLAGCAGVVFALRTRSFPLIAQRVPLLVAAVVTTLLLGGHWLHNLAGLPPLVVAGAAGLLGFVLVFASSAYQTRMPSPYVSRCADLLDAIATLAFVPLACGALGLFGLIRTLGD